MIGQYTINIPKIFQVFFFHSLLFTFGNLSSCRSKKSETLVDKNRRPDIQILLTDKDNDDDDDDDNYASSGTQGQIVGREKV